MVELLYDILNVAVYSVLGIVLMLVGNFLIDLIVPCHFPTEIKKGNIAVGWLSAGSFIGIGMILRTVIMSPAAAVTETLLSGITSSAIYFVVGIVFFMLGYVTVLFYNRKYNLNDAGVMVFGIFVGLSLVISGAIS